MVEIDEDHLFDKAGKKNFFEVIRQLQSGYDCIRIHH